MKRVLSLFLAAVMVLSIFAGLQISSSALSASGQCGDDVYWSFNESTGMLTISGTGDMYDYPQIKGYGYWYKASPFLEHSEIISVVVEEGVTSVGERMFFICEGLKRVVLPESIIKINSGAFNLCNQLKEVRIADNIKEIGEYAFLGCENLETINLPDSIIKIGSGIFEDSGFYKDVNNWDGDLLYVGKHLVDTHPQLSGNCIVKEGTKTIAADAFWGTSELESVEIPKSVTEINKYTFRFSGIKSIEIPDSVTKIDEGAFYECKNLESIKLSNTSESIGDKAFYECSSLKNVVLPNSVTQIGTYAFGYCTSLESVTIGNRLENMAVRAFDGCKAIKTISIAFCREDGISEIVVGEYAFNAADKIETVKIGKCVKVINYEAFDNYAEISEVYYAGKINDWNDINFSYSNRSLKECKNIHFECEAPCAEHKNVTTLKENSVAATCTKEGSYDEVIKCKECGAEISRTHKTVSKLAHKTIKDKAIAATCDKAGKTEGSHCKACGKIIVAQKVIKAKGHKIVIDKAVAPTFRTAGKTEGKHCSTCRKVFVKQQAIPKYKTTTVTTVTVISKGFKVGWRTVKNIDGYQIQYSTAANFKTDCKTITVKGYKSASRTIKKLKSKKKYYVRIRAFKKINGKVQYSTWSAAKAITTKK